MKNKGIINKYIITRTDGNEINPNNKYFVLKLEGDGDQNHIEACREAILTYAEKIKDHLPELSKEIINKYSF